MKWNDNKNIFLTIKEAQLSVSIVLDKVKGLTNVSSFFFFFYN